MYTPAVENQRRLTGVPTLKRPRLGFLGIDQIARHRLQALQRKGVADIVAVAGPNAQAPRLTRQLLPEAVQLRSLNELLQQDLDGLVIATPHALDGRQTIRALESGLAVFCQKPLGRTQMETEQVLMAAREADRLLGLDLSYRHINGVTEMRELIQQGDLGDVIAVDLVYHSAYGPDKDWVFEPEKSGGGCLLDLGIHLIDLALWSLNYPEVGEVCSRLYAKGKPVALGTDAIEDYVVAQFDLSNGAVVQMTCSWNAPAGCDAVIEATFHGSRGGATLRNRNGSFYGFTVERSYGTARQIIDQTFEDWDWGGRAAVQWAEKLALEARYDAEIDRAAEVAGVVDAIYGKAKTAV